MTKVQIKDLLRKAANRRKGIGAIPVGLRFTIAGVKMFVEAQFDIYNKVHINIIDEKTKKTIVKVDGVVRNKKEQAEKLLKYVAKNAEIQDRSLPLYSNNTKKIINELSSEVNLYNNPKKATTTKRTVKRTSTASADRQGFLYRSTASGVRSVPKSSLTRYRNSKYPNEKFFVGKFDGIWFVLELTSGLSIGSGTTKKQAIEEADRILNKIDVSFFKEKVKDRKLPKEYLDKAMMPYKYKTSSKTSTPKAKITPIKTKTMATKRTTSKPAAKKAALKVDGTLKKGFKYAKGGKIVKAGAAATAKPAAKRTKAKKTYVKLRQTGATSLKLDAKKKASKPGKRVSKAGAKNQYGTTEGGNTYYEYRANRTDLKPKKRGRSL